MNKYNKKKQLKCEYKKIDIDQILLQKRALFLFDYIDNNVAKKLIKEMLALNKQKKAPILLYINSPGGDVSAGFAIIDVIQSLASTIITIIIGESCSMAGVISIAGKERLISKHSIWMSHDMAGGIQGDYTSKVLDRAEFLKKEQKKLFDFIRQNTKLSEAEINQAINGELWLYPNECLEKGIVDGIAK